MNSRYAAGMTLFTAFVLSLCLVSFVKPTTPAGKPAQVILIRHAEKPPEGEELSERGKERAWALAPFFQGRPEVLRFGTPVAIYGQRPKKSTSSVRPVDPVPPLADALQMQVNVEFTRKGYQALADDILTNSAYAGRMVLVCWEHTAIPDLARALGASQAPSQWHGKSFDRLWIITYPPEGKVAFEDLPQKLLFGDAAH
jgi:hypothetical protein